MESIYLVDFDHTISRKDVWDAIVKHCAPTEWQALIDEYLKGNLSSRQCNLKLAELVNKPEDDLRQIIEEIGIDPTFHDFVQWLEVRETEMVIVSDGYDYYIELLLQLEGLNHIPRFCNNLTWTESGVDVHFPLSHPECERDMAHCKCIHATENEGKRRVYIGDGISDTCVARKCEVIYAKRNLLDFCIDQGLDHQPFSTFEDVIKQENDQLISMGTGPSLC